MADDIAIKDAGDASRTVATDEVGGRNFQLVKICYGADGAVTQVDAGGNPLPVGIVGTVPVVGTVAIAGGVAVSGPLTDTQLRASALPVSGPLTDTQLRAAAVPVALGASQAFDDVATAVALAVGGIRSDAEGSSPVSASGDFHPFLFNKYGRLKVSAAPADLGQTTGSITANGQSVAVQISRFSNLSISMVASSLVGHNVSFEASNNSTDGSDGTWYQVQVVRSNANTVETTSGVLAATPAYMWQVNASDYGWFRVRATAHTSGSAAYTINPSAYVSEPVPAIQVTGTQAVSGTVTANIGTGSLAAGTNLVGDVATGVRASATNAASGTHVIAAASTNATIVKASAGRVYGWAFGNTSAAWRFVKLHNQATTPTAGSGVVRTIAIPPGGLAQLHVDAGIGFATGIGLTIVTGSADSDATAVTAGDVIGELFFA